MTLTLADTSVSSAVLDVRLVLFFWQSDPFFDPKAAASASLKTAV